MRKLLISAMVAAGLTIGGGSVLAAGGEAGAEAEMETPAAVEQSGATETGMTSEYPDEFTGEVTAIDGETIKVRTEDGLTHSFTLTGAQDLGQLSAETLQVGDRVYVDFIRQGEGQYKQGDEIEIHKLSESGSGTWMMQEEDGMMEGETDAMEGTDAVEETESMEESGAMEGEAPTEAGEADFQEESRTPADEPIE